MTKYEELISHISDYIKNYYDLEQELEFKIFEQKGNIIKLHLERIKK
jgi:hypothetical protein